MLAQATLCLTLQSLAIYAYSMCCLADDAKSRKKHVEIGVRTYPGGLQ